MKLDSKVFRKAANLIAEDKEDFACDAVERFANSDQYLSILNDYFNVSDSFVFFSSFENGLTDQETRVHTKLGRLRRAVALDLLAEMIESGDM